MRRHLEILTSGLNSMGHVVSLAGEAPDIGFEAERSLTVHIVDGLRVAKDLRALWVLRRALSLDRYDLVHAHGWKAGLLAAAARYPRRFPPLVLTIHNDLPPQFSGARKAAVAELARVALSCADRIICVSAFLLGRAASLRPDCSRKAVLIHNGIALGSSSRDLRGPLGSRRSPVGLPDRRKGDRVIGTVCRLIPEKGLLELVEAFEICRSELDTSLQLWVVGDGPCMTELRQAIRARGLEESVWLAGWRDDAVRLMEEMDVFVLASYSEGMPLTILEAMSVGTPVVATEVGGIPELVAHGETGLLVRPRDPLALSRSILRVLRDPSLASALGRAAMERVRDEFGDDRMVEKTIQVYQGVVPGATESMNTHQV